MPALQLESSSYGYPSEQSGGCCKCCDCEQKTRRNSAVYIAAPALSFLFLVIAFSVYESTYGTEWEATLSWALLFVVQLLGTFICLSFVYLITYCLVEKCQVCGCGDYSDEFPSYCCLTFKTSVLFYAVHLSLWYMLVTISVVLHHPFWRGPYDEVFIGGEDLYSSDGNSDDDVTFRPWPQTTQWESEILTPATSGEIADIINEVVADIESGADRTVRPVGNGHSWSPVYTNDVMISLEQFTDIDLDEEAMTVTVGAGVVVEDLEDYLFDFGYVLMGFGNFQEQRMAGMLGHGVYNAFGSMSQYTRTIWMVDGNGDEIVVSQDDSNSTLIYAARVNLGLLGVVYQIQFDIQHSFNVAQEEKDLDSLTEFAKDYTLQEFRDLMLPDEDTEDDVVGIKLYVTLADADDNDKSIAVVRYKNTTDEATQIDYETNDFLKNSYDSFIQYLGCVSNGIFAFGSQFITTFADEETIYPVKSSLRTDHIFSGGLLYFVPFENCASVIDEVIDTANDLRIDEDLLTELMVVIAVHKNEENGYLSYMFDNDVCLIELYPNVCSNDRVSLAYEVEKIVLENNGAAHWGKQWFNQDTFDETRNAWSMFDEFNSVRNVLDPNNLFLNEYFGNIFEYDSEKADIEYPLMEQYSINGQTLKNVSLALLIIPGCLVCVWYLLILCGKIDNIFDPDAPIYEPTCRKYWIVIVLSLIVEAVIGVLIVVISQTTTDAIV